MLHITNGDSAASILCQAQVPGFILSWRDVLHEGPVPAELSFDELRTIRSHFIADCGWENFATALRGFAERDATLAAFRSHEEVILWFEHDLYDQLQLVQLLDFFAHHDYDGTSLSLICTDEYLGTSTPARLQALYEGRGAVMRNQIELGCEAWTAFRSADPTELLRLFRSDTSVLPFLSGALLRHLEQFPSTRSGLNRSESQALEALRLGPMTVKEMFNATQAQEERRFLGDATFFLYLEELSVRGEPLVCLEGGGRIRAPRGPGVPAFLDQRIRLTPAGSAVLEGRADRIALNGINRWLGGVHLRGGATWRWDGNTQELRLR